MKTLKKLTLLALFITVIACSKDDPTTPESPVVPPVAEKSVKEYQKNDTNEKVVFQPNAIMVKADINDNFVSLTADGIMTFKSSDALNLIKNGDVLYSLPTKDFPDGYVVKVVSKTTDGNTTKYNIVDANFEEVFKNLKVASAYGITTDMSKIKIYDPQSVGIANDLQSKNAFQKTLLATTNTKAMGLNFPNNYNQNLAIDPKTQIIANERLIVKPFPDGKGGIYFEYILYDYDKNYKDTKYDQIIAKVKITSDLSTMNIGWDGLLLEGDKKAFSATGNPRFSVEVTLSYDVEASPNDAIKEVLEKEYHKQVLNNKIPLGEFPLDAKSPIGLIIRPQIVPYVKFRASASASMSITAKYQNFGFDFDISSNDALNASSYIKSFKGVKGETNIEFENSVETSMIFAPGIGLENVFFSNFNILKKLKGESDQKAYIGNYLEWNTTIALKNTLTTNENGQICNEFTATPEMYLDCYSEGAFTFFGTKIELEKQTIWASEGVQGLKSYSYKKCFNAPPIPTTGLVAYYPFNGNANDESNNNNNGTVNGATLTTDRHGKENSAYEFGGMNNTNSISIASSSSLDFNNEATYSFFVKLNSEVGSSPFVGAGTTPMIGGGQAIFAKPHDQSNGYAGLISSSENGTFISVGSFYGVSGGLNNPAPQTNLNNWYHILFVFENGATKIYINGQLKGKTTSGSINVANGQPLYFGKYSDYWYPLNGKLDDIRIYNRALSDSEVEALYNAEK
jgi:hypothetical protein